MLSEEGIRTVSCVVREAALYSYGALKIKDITAPCGLASLLRMEIWKPVPLLPLIFRMTPLNLMMVSPQHLNRLILLRCVGIL